MQGPTEISKPLLSVSVCLRAQLLDALRLGSSEAHHSLAEGDAQIIPWPIASMEVADARAA